MNHPAIRCSAGHPMVRANCTRTHKFQMVVSILNLCVRVQVEGGAHQPCRPLEELPKADRVLAPLCTHRRYVQPILGTRGRERL